DSATPYHRTPIRPHRTTELRFGHTVPPNSDSATSYHRTPIRPHRTTELRFGHTVPPNSNSATPYHQTLFGRMIDKTMVHVNLQNGVQQVYTIGH
ncbi:MAG: hypothetical protein SGI94_01530, partial [Saprospiraceae bacterium]|nr:hypothetical protein [Saprospiraceae bacterium]